jgi:hypothetical protein
MLFVPSAWLCFSGRPGRANYNLVRTTGRLYDRGLHGSERLGLSVKGGCVPRTVDGATDVDEIGGLVKMTQPFTTKVVLVVVCPSAVNASPIIANAGCPMFIGLPPPSEA